MPRRRLLTNRATSRAQQRTVRFAPLETSFRRATIESLERRLCLSTAYSFDVIAKTGDQVSYLNNFNGPSGTLTAFGGAPSINNQGEVAFNGLYASGSGVFVGGGNGGTQNISLGFSGVSGRIFGSAIQINDRNEVLAVDQVAGAPTRYFLQLWNTLTGIAETENQAPGGSFDSLQSIFSAADTVNNNNSVAFVGFDGSSVELNTADTTVATFLSPQPTLHPMIADNGDIVVRDGPNSVNYISVYDASTGNKTDIASSTNDFLVTGAEPGISDDGKVIAFYGEGSPLGNGPKLGDGIFAAINVNNNWQIQKIAGISGDGRLDP